MTQDHEDLIYESIRRMVTWGEPRADVFHKLEVNGIVGAKADEMYARARAERIQTIRGDAMRKTIWGLIFICMGAGSFIQFYFYFGSMPRLVLTLCISSFSFGIWRFFHGLFGYIFAPSKEGSLADDE